jgi:hypothetical protein
VAYFVHVDMSCLLVNPGIDVEHVLPIMGIAMVALRVEINAQLL